MKTLLIGMTAILSLTAARGAVATVPATADTSLHENFPNNNMGASTHMSAGLIRIPVGGSEFGRTHGLVRFDLTGKVPAGAVVTAVKLNVSVTFSPGGPGSDFELHRLLRSWTEGTKSGLTGGTATAGEVTWNRLAAPGTMWGEPGATSPLDIVLASSSSVFMDAPNRYTFPSTGTLVADVQGWLNDPSSNFGWLIDSSLSGEGQTVRRIGSRESGAATAPSLEITYNVPAAELKIVEARRTEGGMFLSWTGGTPPYRIARAESILGPWDFVTVATTETSTTAPFGTDASYYRVAGEAP